MHLRNCERCGAPEGADNRLTTNSRIVGGLVLPGSQTTCLNRTACTQRLMRQRPPSFEERHNAVIAQRQLRLVR